MTHNETPVTASEIAVRLFYPDALVNTTIDKSDGKEFCYIWGGTNVVGSGRTEAEAWKHAADVIEKKMILQ